MTLLAFLLTWMQPAPLSVWLRQTALAWLVLLPALLFARLLPKALRTEFVLRSGFCDALQVGLPLTALIWGGDAAAVVPFAVMHWLAYRFIGGWLLRRSGMGTEKNFTLILAYRQTIAHAAHFPDEIHPVQNPLFQPARDAERELRMLLPCAAIVAASVLHGFLPLPLPGCLLRLCAAAVLVCSLRSCLQLRRNSALRGMHAIISPLMTPAALILFAAPLHCGPVQMLMLMAILPANPDLLQYMKNSVR